MADNGSGERRMGRNKGDGYGGGGYLVELYVSCMTNWGACISP